MLDFDNMETTVVILAVIGTEIYETMNERRMIEDFAEAETESETLSVLIESEEIVLDIIDKRYYFSIIYTPKKENRYILYLSSKLPDFIVIKADSLSKETERKLNLRLMK